MIPIVTPAEMAAIDAAASDPVEVLIERAGTAVARTAVDMLGGAYGRRVNVLAGAGNNGADGRVAARRLRQRGVRCQIFDPSERHLPPADLTIDAAYGTGLSRPYVAPVAIGPVLAVDIPSGVDGLTGELVGEPLAADRTITFAALKPGLLLEPGASLTGEVRVADVGLAVDDARFHLLTNADVADWWPQRRRTDHKWKQAVWIIGGSAGMAGAPSLAAAGAQRTGAGMVRLSIPDCDAGDATYAQMPTEAVGFALTGEWAATISSDMARFGALVVGPGLGRDPSVLEQVGRLIASTNVPTVVDADGLAALKSVIGSASLGSVVITPHDGEYSMLTGQSPAPDRFMAATRLAADAGAHVLLKGPTTIVASPHGACLAVRSGDERLATAGSGDVLAGMIGALLASGLPPLEAAATAAHVHGLAARQGPKRGLIAGDLPDAIPAVVDLMTQPGNH